MPTRPFDSNANNPEAWRRHRRPGGVTTSALVGTAVLLLLPLLPQQVHAQDADRMTVAHVSQPTMDPCPSRGEIQGLDPQGDGFLAVRTGPGTDHEQIDELHNGDLVILCDYENGWHGVVYPQEGQEAAECYAGAEQLADPESYRGPCRSGWVHGNWVRWIWR
jgi:hypothetical protein